MCICGWKESLHKACPRELTTNLHLLAMQFTQSNCAPDEILINLKGHQSPVRSQGRSSLAKASVMRRYQGIAGHAFPFIIIKHCRLRKAGFHGRNSSLLVGTTAVNPSCLRLQCSLQDLSTFQGNMCSVLEISRYKIKAHLKR